MEFEYAERLGRKTKESSSAVFAIVPDVLSPYFSSLRDWSTIFSPLCICRVISSFLSSCSFVMDLALCESMPSMIFNVSISKMGEEEKPLGTMASEETGDISSTLLQFESLEEVEQEEINKRRTSEKSNMVLELIMFIGPVT